MEFKIKWKELYETLKNPNVLITSIAVPILAALVSTIPSCNLSREANKTAQRISDITNRPYILFENVKLSSSEKQITQDKSGIRIDSEFTIYNNGTLPAWIIGYDIYVKGEKRAILANLNPEDKPTLNFTIGKDKSCLNKLWFSLMQGIKENGDVTDFEKAKYKLALITVRYKSLGDSNNNNIFTYWEMFRLDAKHEGTARVQCGTNTLDSVEAATHEFKKQEKRFTGEIQGQVGKPQNNVFKSYLIQPSPSTAPSGVQEIKPGSIPYAVIQPQSNSTKAAQDK